MIELCAHSRLTLNNLFSSSDCFLYSSSRCQSSAISPFVQSPYRHQVASVVPAITLGKQLNAKQCMVGTYRNKVSPGCFHPWLAIQVVCMVWQWPIRTLFRTKTGTHLSVMCHFEHNTIKWRVVHFSISFWEDNPTILYYDVIGALSCWKEAEKWTTPTLIPLFEVCFDLSVITLYSPLYLYLVACQNHCHW